MMKRIRSLFSLLIISLALSACTTVPVMPVWPAVPAELTQPCAPLITLRADQTQLSDLLQAITENYARAHACAAQNAAWQEWYDTQREIYNSVRP